MVCGPVSPNNFVQIYLQQHSTQHGTRKRSKTLRLTLIMKSKACLRRVRGVEEHSRSSVRGYSSFYICEHSEQPSQGCSVMHSCLTLCCKAQKHMSSPGQHSRVGTEAISHHE